MKDLSNLRIELVYCAGKLIAAECNGWLVYPHGAESLERFLERVAQHVSENTSLIKLG